MTRLVKVSLEEQFARIHQTWSQRVVANVNDFAVKIAKLEGEFVWHQHEDEDEVFLIVSGRIRMRYRADGAEHETTFGAGELLCVPHGVEHLPVALEPTEIVLFERAETVNTGTAPANDYTHKPQPI